MKFLNITQASPECQEMALRRCQNLPHSGKLMSTASGYIYLKADDRFISAVFPGMKTFAGFEAAGRNIGAHLSVIHEGEFRGVVHEIGQVFSFDLDGLFTAPLGEKIYLAFSVKSAPLSNIRRKYGLSETHLFFRDTWVPFHLTIAGRYS